MIDFHQVTVLVKRWLNQEKEADGHKQKILDFFMRSLHTNYQASRFEELFP